ncbi:two-component system, transcriptional response regulator [Corynebacterium glutamicum MB001]|uniref:Two-component system, response regulators consisting of a CheY-like receiver domain and a HTH DNA-binding domain n=1 Tax=Corynebacterium glutamicum (strain ATCC 13032 / DSM 20300 / JCM 1318 / BCRC 11384 / CCUG 27702 / LMG 3730 / NBRC 12168 / NCIMB 10025 / NRRL B-2784 / 534) TaxID=196627 RepID=Q8NP17_CORGL|nr:response regulator transcription factor [Corynebacterium glutamicum]AGT05749.1 two-component system, transcriptional response regulator [Corynebacterium glutamicum MB001]ARV63933.1 DNA-binding response regulator [Corynebacterium glutamicum]ASW14399.1 two-component system, transcriptional response regulator [Corynebacterium glutamicum]AUI01477.1 DNA-binding response regulator [Corynebacterium glutamicum]AUI05125.1 DNA-binding response regulator [Corynebacterium glutamicum]
MIRILLADDHPVVRAGLASLLVSEDDFEIVDMVGTPDDAVARAAEGGVDVVLMDLRFGDQPGIEVAGGVEATRRIRALDNPPQVLVVTNYSTDGDVVGAVSAGAVGYLLKDSSPEDLIAGVRDAARGESVLSKQVASKIMGRMNNPMTALSAREIEVLSLVAQGQSNREIGKKLFLTEATVKSHMGHVFNKLDVTSRTAAVAEARQRGII